MAKLTKRVVDATKPNPDRDVTLWDEALRGFGLRIWPSGLKVFVIQYRNAQGRLRRLTVGELGRLTPEEARQQARQLLAEVEKGGDPLQTRKQARDGRYKVADLQRADVAKLHHALGNIPTEANRTLSVLKTMMNLAERWGLRPDGTNPCRYVDRYPERKRERFLTAEEIGRLGRVLSEAESSGVEMPGVTLAVRLLALTGMRRSEVLGLRWEYVDTERSCFFLPDSKTGRKAVPIGPPVLELLARTPRTEGNPYVCAGMREGAPLVGIDKAWKRLASAAGLDGVRLHDLRHSFASIGAAAGLGLPILGAILGHSSPATTARYAHLADDPRRMGAARISREIAAALNGQPAGEVVPFP